MTISKRNSHYKTKNLEEHMPKIITESEKNKLKELMYQKTLVLIKEKGLRKVTVEDITKYCGLAKGSFYYYYDSKEAFLYEVLKRNEKDSFEKMLQIKVNEKDKRSQLTQVFKYIFMSESCLFLYTTPEDLEYLLVRLPDKIRELEKEKSETNFMGITDWLGVKNTKENYGTLSYLMDGLQCIASSRQYGLEGRERAMELLIDTICQFIEEVS